MKSTFCILIFCLALSLTADAQIIIFSDNFESGTFGASWTATPGTPNGVVSINASIGNPSRGVRMGKSSAGGFVTNTLDLTLNLSAYSNSDIAMTFDIKDLGDDTQIEDGLYFSDDGGLTFEKVFDFNPSLWCDDNYGSFPPFDIDSLAAINGLNLTSNFVIRFQQYGDNTFSNNSGFYLDNVSIFTQTITYVNIFPFTDGFEASNTLQNMWTNSFPWQTNTLSTDPNRPNNAVEIGSNIGFGGGRAVRMGKNCADGFSTNALDLHLNLSGGSDYALTFDIEDQGDDTQVDDGLYFSDNGGVTFKKVFDFNPSLWCDNNYGSFPPFDIDSLAALQGLNLTDKFVIRFQQHGDNTFSNNNGFYIDNVSVFVPTLVYQGQFPFTDNFETGTLGPQWKRSFPWQTSTLVTDPNRPNSIVDITNGAGAGGGRGIRMGKDCSDGFSTNALDLHLNLSGGSDYALTFDIEDQGDDTQVDDGLYFSDNGGVTFKKVFDFNPSLWCDNNYGSFPPFDIDSLAALQGLNLTDKFVIRFQQHGDNTFSNNNGFYIDNVSVFVPTLVYQGQFPFTDNFETGTLGPQWKRSFPWQTSTLVTDPNRPNSIVDIANFTGISNSRAVRMGKDCADGFSTNALDLHLNLSGLGQVILNCKIRDLGDETDFDDGVYLSNNGGETFKKVFDFDFGNVPDSYTDYSFDLGALATSNGLSFSSRFIVRFQQHGDNTFSNNNGIYIDNVNITGVVGANEINLFDGFSIYPNPAREHLTLDISDFFSKGDLYFEIKNLIGIPITGRKILNSKEIIDIKTIPDGLYIVEIISSNGRASKKVLKLGE
ncbi:T9SS type A sorting domain-containing protein [Runella sp.]|uniref:T9SS type A sorting domain-containing protein n=1 Tax=Runella sp. TaxID=1960881 RepID=UPI003017034F